VKAWARFSRADPGRAKPKGASSGWRTKPPSGRQGLLARVKPQEPGLIGPAHRYGGGSTDGWNGKWVHPGGNTPDTLREGNAPKGESQERCRCEKEPARTRRE
jgi:hypothetical protein